jgi:hypothetical protein
MRIGRGREVIVVVCLEKNQKILKSAYRYHQDQNPMKPILQAILVADQVYQDRRSNKMIVAGIFNSLASFKRPEKESDKPETPPENLGEKRFKPHEIQRAGSPFCYLNLTGVHGTVELELRYVDLSDNNVLFKIGFFVKANDPLENIECAMPIPSLPKPHVPGSYALELMTGDELIGSHRIKAIEIMPPKEPGEG